MAAPLPDLPALTGAVNHNVAAAPPPPVPGSMPPPVALPQVGALTQAHHAQHAQPRVVAPGLGHFDGHVNAPGQIGKPLVGAGVKRKSTSSSSQEQSEFPLQNGLPMPKPIAGSVLSQQQPSPSNDPHFHLKFVAEDTTCREKILSLKTGADLRRLGHRLHEFHAK